PATATRPSAARPSNPPIACGQAGRSLDGSRSGSAAWRGVVPCQTVRVNGSGVETSGRSDATATVVDAATGAGPACAAGAETADASAEVLSSTVGSGAADAAGAALTRDVPAGGHGSPPTA